MFLEIYFITLLKLDAINSNCTGTCEMAILNKYPLEIFHQSAWTIHYLLRACCLYQQSVVIVPLGAVLMLYNNNDVTLLFSGWPVSVTMEP